MRVLPDPELTPEELKELQQIRDTHPRKTIRRRAHVILLAHKKYQGQEIARILDMSPNGVSNILRNWGFDRLPSITRKKHQGKLPRLTDLHSNQMIAWLQEDPRKYGYQRTTWTCQMLADQLKEQYGLTISAERVRQVLHARGWSYKQPALQPPTAPVEAKKKRNKSSWTC